MEVLNDVINFNHVLLDVCGIANSEPRELDDNCSHNFFVFDSLIANKDNLKIDIGIFYSKKESKPSLDVIYKSL